MISKQLKLIIVLLCIVVALAIAAAVLSAVLKNDEPPVEKTELLPGEGEGTSSKPLIIEEIAEEDIAKVTVWNKNGHFTAVNNTAKNILGIEGLENYPLDTDAVSELIKFGTRILVSRVDTEPESLSNYGLSAADDPAVISIKQKNGKQNDLYFGLMSADGSSYYVMADDRLVVYSIPKSSVQTLLEAKAEDFISTIAAPELEDINYVYIDYIKIKHGNEDFIAFEKVDEEYRQNTGYMLTHKMTYPTSYLVDITNFEKLLSSFKSLYGTKVIGYGYIRNDDFTPLAEYGFTDDYITVEYAYSNVPTVLYIGDKTADGSGYYVYSLFYDTLLEVSVDSLPFAEWSLGDYIGKNLFQMNIKYVNKITAEKSGKNYDFTLINADGKLFVLSDGKYLENDEKGDCANFRAFYKSILKLDWDGYADIPETLGDPVLKLSISTTFGENYDFVFYRTSTLRCYYTYNGYGEFFVEKDDLDKFIADIEKVSQNIEITEQ